MARGNPAMKSKRVTGPTPNTELVTRMRVQEMNAGGTLAWRPSTGKRFMVRPFVIEEDTPEPGITTTIHANGTLRGFTLPK